MLGVSRRAAKWLRLKPMPVVSGRWVMGHVLSGTRGAPRGKVPRGAMRDHIGMSRFSASSDPIRSLPSAAAGRTMSSQVPAGTSAQALP